MEGPIPSPGAATDPDAVEQVDGPVRILLLGAGDADRRRIEQHEGFCLVEEQEGGPDVVLVSTRLPRNEAIGHVTADAAAVPIIALVHTGGEALAADLLRTGARGLLAEGNESAIRAFLTRGGQDTGLLEVYDHHVGRTQVLGQGQRTQELITGLPNAAAFDSRITEEQLAGDVPRVGFARLLFLVHADHRSVDGAISLIRRRLSLRLRDIAADFGIDLYALSDTDYAFVGPGLAPHRVEQLGSAMSQAAGAFAPWGHPLAFAVGHAGSEVSQDVVTVRQLAQRAVDAAAMEQRSTVVDAETLALGASSTTELEAALRLVEVVEREDPMGPGQALEVAELSGAVAWELGYEGRVRASIRLAAHLHDIGKISLPKEAMFATEGLSGELQLAARSHPVRGADYLRPLAGPEIAAAVRAQHERWDGTGFPDGLVGDQIPVAARIIALVVDYLRASRAQGQADALSVVTAAAGSAYDPSIVEAAGLAAFAGAR